MSRKPTPWNPRGAPTEGTEPRRQGRWSRLTCLVPGPGLALLASFLLMAVFWGDPEHGDHKPLRRGGQDGLDQLVAPVAFSPDGSFLASGNSNKTVRLLDVSEASSPAIKTGRVGRNATVYALAFSPDSRSLALAEMTDFVTAWDLTRDSVKRFGRGQGEGYRTLAFSPDGLTLAGGGSDTPIRLWDYASGRERLALGGHNDKVSCIQFSPDGSTLAAGSFDGKVHLWDPEGARERAVLRPGKSVLCLTYSPDGRTLAVGCFKDERVRLWDLVEGREVPGYPGHVGGVTSVAFAPDGTFLASGGVDRTVKLWRRPDGRNMAIARGHSGWVKSVAFSPDGKSLASGGDDGNVRLWRLLPEQDGLTLTAAELSSNPSDQAADNPVLLEEDLGRASGSRSEHDFVSLDTAVDPAARSEGSQ
jgi:WD40 repeat protein